MVSTRAIRCFLPQATSFDFIVGGTEDASTNATNRVNIGISMSHCTDGSEIGKSIVLLECVLCSPFTS